MTVPGNWAGSDGNEFCNCDSLHIGFRFTYARQIPIDGLGISERYSRLKRVVCKTKSVAG